MTSDGGQQLARVSIVDAEGGLRAAGRRRVRSAAKSEDSEVSWPRGSIFTIASSASQRSSCVFSIPSTADWERQDAPCLSSGESVAALSSCLALLLSPRTPSRTQLRHALSSGHAHPAVHAALLQLQALEAVDAAVAGAVVCALRGAAWVQERVAAATRIQARQRGRAGRQRVEQKRKEREAATRIQALQRGNAGRKAAARQRSELQAPRGPSEADMMSLSSCLALLLSPRTPSRTQLRHALSSGHAHPAVHAALLQLQALEAVDAAVAGAVVCALRGAAWVQERVAAATRIQARQRGRAGRQRVEQRKFFAQRTREEAAAATRIQAVQRGRTARRRLKKHEVAPPSSTLLSVDDGALHAQDIDTLTSCVHYLLDGPAAPLTSPRLLALLHGSARHSFSARHAVASVACRIRQTHMAAAAVGAALCSAAAASDPEVFLTRLQFIARIALRRVSSAPSSAVPTRRVEIGLQTRTAAGRRSTCASVPWGGTTGASDSASCAFDLTGVDDEDTASESTPRGTTRSSVVTVVQAMRDAAVGCDLYERSEASPPTVAPGCTTACQTFPQGLRDTAVGMPFGGASLSVDTATQMMPREACDRDAPQGACLPAMCTAAARASIGRVSLPSATAWADAAAQMTPREVRDVAAGGSVGRASLVSAETGYAVQRAVPDVCDAAVGGSVGCATYGADAATQMTPCEVRDAALEGSVRRASVTSAGALWTSPARDVCPPGAAPAVGVGASTQTFPKEQGTATQTTPRRLVHATLPPLLDRPPAPHAAVDVGAQTVDRQPPLPPTAPEAPAERPLPACGDFASQTTPRRPTSDAAVSVGVKYSERGAQCSVRWRVAATQTGVPAAAEPTSAPAVRIDTPPLRAKPLPAQQRARGEAKLRRVQRRAYTPLSYQHFYNAHPLKPRTAPHRSRLQVLLDQEEAMLRRQSAVLKDLRQSRKEIHALEKPFRVQSPYAPPSRWSPQ
eukprot:TRINITY_DN3029_c0_g1_i1.p1 TRINITY_DN3029_c0_g1~~TRINITY_DN3029_c0_g1_i1.p1  ORF type:complete len:968 (+),score=179.84 TRINITY_DN3029_c0_g1_i1:145-3048(+)